jgi:hypothetical protein
MYKNILLGNTMEIAEIQKTQKNEYKYYCQYCEYYTCNRYDMSKHKTRRKHIIMVEKQTLEIKKSQLCSETDKKTTEISALDVVTPLPVSCEKKNECSECGKIYKTASGLWKHHKLCKPIATVTNDIFHISNSELNDKDHLFSTLVEQNLTLITQNEEFKQLIIEQNNKIIELCKDKGVIVNNTTHHNNTTNNFNLKFFLNVQCKDALNISDFVDSLVLQVKDLEETGRIGYSDGISKIFIRGLKELDVYKRPIHCSDLKRETIYIKENDMWEKENEEKEKLKGVIKKIANKNIKQIPLWQKENPQYVDGSCKKNDEYLQLITNTMIGSDDDETDRNYHKIISNVAKEVIIQKI